MTAFGAGSDLIVTDLFTLIFLIYFQPFFVNVNANK